MNMTALKKKKATLIACSLTRQMGSIDPATMDNELQIIQWVFRMHLLEQSIMQAAEWHGIPRQDEVRWQALMLERSSIIRSDDWLTDCPVADLLEYREQLMDLAREYTRLLWRNGIQYDNFTGRYALDRFTSANFGIDMMLQR